MKRKIFNTIIDILLVAVVFAVTDGALIHVFHSENLWQELGIYIVFYGIVFGTKSGIVHLWKKRHGTGEAIQDGQKKRLFTDHFC